MSTTETRPFAKGFPGLRARGRLYRAGALAAMVLAGVGCASPGAGTAGALKVTVLQVGGPLLPNGSEPTQPVSNAEVNVAANGTSRSAATNSAGVATFRLPGGSYFVSSPTCGSTGSVKVTVAPGRLATLSWICPVP